MRSVLFFYGLVIIWVGETGVSWDKFWLGQCPSAQTSGQMATLIMFSESTRSRPILVLHAIVTHVL